MICEILLINQFTSQNTLIFNEVIFLFVKVNFYNFLKFVFFNFEQIIAQKINYREMNFKSFVMEFIY